MNIFTQRDIFDIIYTASGVAQQAERVAVNHQVGGSRPSPGALKEND
jgi:hypothetical protein